MFGGCRHSFRSARLRPFQPFPYGPEHTSIGQNSAVFVQVSNSATRSSKSSDTVFSKDTVTRRLPSVPPLRKHLLAGSQLAADSELLWLLSDSTRQINDPQHIFKVLERLVKSKRIREVSTYNAILSRFQCLERPPPASLVYAAMESASDNPAAMKSLLGLDQEYLSLESYVRGASFRADHKKPPRENRETRVEERRKRHPNHEMLFKERRAELLIRICKAISAHLTESFPKLVPERIRIQWVNVITGWRENSSNQNPLPRPPTERDHSLFNLGPAEPAQCWSHYILLLSQVASGKVIEGEWRAIQAKMENQVHEYKNERLSAQNPFLNSTIQALVNARDLERAWTLIDETKVEIRDLDRDTLRLLLAHPEYLKAWNPEFNDMALEILETGIRRLETHFGVQWEGGEDGFHRIQWSSQEGI